MMSHSKFQVFAHDLGLLAMRLMVGFVFVYHGSQKLFGWFGGGGMAPFIDGVEQMGLPLPAVNAYMAAGSEFFGGVLLMLGLFMRLATIPMIFTMLVASFVVHRQAFGLQNNGMEYALTLAVVLFGLAMLGSGRFAVGRLFAGRKNIIAKAAAF